MIQINCIGAIADRKHQHQKSSRYGVTLVKGTITTMDQHYSAYLKLSDRH
ncbi:hypothetical protein H6G80_34360 [Nostoc sp. FACHB-87]|nr:MULTISPECIES: hypothetical protein [Nostocaceae]MBD2459120.1 hypothetical protein [Nostoc sp. FACHB-87]MBD2479724.1 hypothetical protein [Anabaena sp. FACHB-83]